jgi:hypothetical protein
MTFLILIFLFFGGLDFLEVLWKRSPQAATALIGCLAVCGTLIVCAHILSHNPA